MVHKVDMEMKIIHIKSFLFNSVSAFIQNVWRYQDTAELFQKAEILNRVLKYSYQVYMNR